MGAAGPNAAKLAREFVRLDNVHPAGDTPAAALNWAVAAIAPDFTERLGPSFAAGRLRYDGFEGAEPANLPPAGYVWSNALSAGLTVRNYGIFVDNGVQPARVKDPSLLDVTNMKYRAADPQAFLDDLKQFESPSGMMPNLTVMRTASDAALGRIVEAVSKSKVWPQTAIFVMNPSGPSPMLLALSPYTRRGAADPTPYDQVSVLRTIELILNLRPMTVFDFSARSLAAAFVSTPNNAPYSDGANQLVTSLCFIWHMHQPFYKDLWTGQYKLPWTRLHALKDYAGMVRVLDEFPSVRQTFNLVPSMVSQIAEYAAGTASDPFFECAAMPAEALTEAQQTFVLRYFFQANVDKIIRRYPRYIELYERRRGPMSIQELRDLQILSQIAWFDEDLLAKDEELKELIRKGRDYSLADQELMVRKQREALAAVLPVYRDFAARGQIEIATTPFYHPILPLLCDSDIAAVSHPGVTLPPRFQYPQDALTQLERARTYMQDMLGVMPTGLWPSEGSVSDEALAMAAGCGFKWAASDNGVLSRTLGKAAGMRRDLSAISLAARRSRDAPAVPRSLPQRPDRIRVFAHGRGGGGGSFSGTDSRKHQPARRAGAHHSGWRKRLGMV